MNDIIKQKNKQTPSGKTVVSPPPPLPSPNQPRKPPNTPQCYLNPPHRARDACAMPPKKNRSSRHRKRKRKKGR
ncbi:hypothetical protein P167DRAFT_198046 [Morchella conica CCBAS932]|uniref:Uncharacterized protein n=1 Tax=Morchella conica CCBAS932 TaxID=1392247 RepID=A0A3N4L240_9PEZI|nr:hypothetical protein P167DRAFT_198046 [Morchella conica CCBAS932]